MMRRPWLVAFALVPEILAIGVLAADCGGGQTPFDGGVASPADGAAVEAGRLSDDAASVIDGADGPDDGGIVAPPDPTTWAPRDLIAARLSRFLWNQTSPDPAIAAGVEAAASADDIAAVAHGMLADSRTRDGLAAFFTWWLRLSELTTQPKDDPDGVFTADVRAALQQEAPAFGTSVILDGDARFETLMTAPYTFMNETIAHHYGITGVTGPELRQVPFGTPDRIGLLGEAGILARFAGNTPASWPPRRFWLVRQTLLCTVGLDSSVPVNVTGFVIDPARPLRQQIETLTAPQTCHICHESVNQFGFAFIKFNSLGQFWADGFAGPYDDASGMLPAGAGGFFTEDLSFADQADFMREMARRPEAMSCFAWVGLNFAVKRPQSAEVNSFSVALRPSLDALARGFEASDGDIRSLLVGIIRAPAFLQTTDPVR